MYLKSIIFSILLIGCQFEKKAGAPKEKFAGIKKQKAGLL
jgi:hypothetical protein